MPQTIPSGGSYTCSFTGTVSGNAGDSQTNVLTAEGVDDEGTPVSDGDDATVTITNVPPAATLTKTVTMVLVTYQVTVTNDSDTEALTLTMLWDNEYGDIADQTNPHIESTNCVVPWTLAPNGNSGDTYTCSFDARAYTSPMTHTVTGTVNDNDGSPPITSSDSATVTFE